MKVSRIRSFLDCSFFNIRGNLFQPIHQFLSPQQKKSNRPTTEAAFRTLSVSYLHYRCFIKPYQQEAHATSLAHLRNLAKLRKSAFAEV